MSHDSPGSVTLGPAQADILAGLLASAAIWPDRPVERVVYGECLVGVMTGPVGPVDAPWPMRPSGPTGSAWADWSVGLASRIARSDDARGPYSYEEAPPSGSGAKVMVRLLLSSDADEASLGMAALNALLPPPPDGLEMKGQELLLEFGRGRDVCVIGHFPFVERMAGEFSNLWVVEKFPRPGDYPEDRAGEFMARADVAVVTGTTLLNGTLANLLAAWRGGSRDGPRGPFILMGPSCPFSPALFDMGVDVLAGARVAQPEIALAGLAGGTCFRGLGGVRTVLWPRPGLLRA